MIFCNNHYPNAKAYHYNYHSIKYFASAKRFFRFVIFQIQKQNETKINIRTLLFRNCCLKQLDIQLPILQYPKSI